MGGTQVVKAQLKNTESEWSSVANESERKENNNRSENNWSWTCWCHRPSIQRNISLLWSTYKTYIPKMITELESQEEIKQMDNEGSDQEANDSENLANLE